MGTYDGSNIFPGEVFIVKFTVTKFTKETLLLSSPKFKSAFLAISFATK